MFDFQHSFHQQFLDVRGKAIKWGKNSPMLIHQLNSHKTAKDKVPIAIGKGTALHR